MKVLLLKDVAGIGNKGQIKEVKQGYALNHMIPRKLAVPADSATVKNFNVAAQAKKDKEAIHEELVKKTLLEIKGKNLIVKAKASEKGKLFKSVHAGDVAKAFEAEYHVKMDDSWLPKNFSIKEVGESSVSVEKFGLKVEFIVKVEAE
jgi:large subunit ribosomal protein L9